MGNKSSAIKHILQDNKLSDDNLKLLCQTFQKYDTNGDGYIDRDEYKDLFKDVIQVLNITIAADSTDNIHESSEFYDFEAADLNGDNRIDFAEFVAQLKVYREGYQLVQEEEDTIRESFEFFDHDRSGKIDSQEMLYALRMLGEKSTKESVEQLFKEFDANGDGQISFEEFRKFRSLLHRVVVHEDYDHGYGDLNDD